MDRALELTIEAAAFTMELPHDVFTASTTLEAIGADSIAIVVIADRIESLEPRASIDNDRLLTVKTIADIAATINWQTS